MRSEPAVEVARDVWRITTPLPFRPRNVHAHLARVRGDAWLLVDGGINSEEAWRVLDGAVRRVAGGWGGVSLHLITHMHLDHIGLAERIRSASGAPLAMGRLDAERSAHAHRHPGEEADYREALLRDHGAPPALVEAVQGGRAAANPLSSFVPADHWLPMETTPLPEAEQWHAVWTPGHTAGHTSLFRPADGTVIAGDAVLPRITPTIGVNRQREDPVGDYLAALDRLAALRPALLLPGHGDPIRDPEARLQELREETRAETERVAALLAPAPAPAWALARRRYADRDLPASMQMQALRETLAHLDRLVALDRARRERDGGVVRFSPSSPGT